MNKTLIISIDDSKGNYCTIFSGKKYLSALCLDELLHRVALAIIKSDETGFYSEHLNSQDLSVQVGCSKEFAIEQKAKYEKAVSDLLKEYGEIKNGLE